MTTTLAVAPHTVSHHHVTSSLRLRRRRLSTRHMFPSPYPYTPSLMSTSAPPHTRRTNIKRAVTVRAVAGEVTQQTNTAATAATMMEVEAEAVPPSYHYTPSPMDNSLLVPQLIGLFFLALCVG